MPPKRANVSAAAAAPVERSESLLATETEKNATSKSLYGDHKARISSNVNSIHDHPRLSAYKLVINSCARGKNILHLGCGMGLGAMLAARALATSVVAVDTSAIIEDAKVVANQNNLSNLTFLRGNIKDLDKEHKLPVSKFDIIFCEWMGAFLTNESIFSDILYCRDALLADGGIICPNKSTLKVAGITDYNYLRDSVDYWDNVYGFSMKPMRPLVLEEASTCQIPRSSVITALVDCHTVDIMTISSDESATRFSFDYSLTAQTKSTLHFLTFYVDAVLEATGMPKFILKSTLGGLNPWTEVSVALKEAIPVLPGDAISGQVTIVPGKNKTEVGVSANCRGSVASISTSGTHIYTY